MSRRQLLPQFARLPGPGDFGPRPRDLQLILRSTGPAASGQLVADIGRHRRRALEVRLNNPAPVPGAAACAGATVLPLATTDWTHPRPGWPLPSPCWPWLLLLGSLLSGLPCGSRPICASVLPPASSSSRP